jgi:hypothetical protein
MPQLSTKLPYQLLLTQWSQALNPVLSSVTATPTLLSNVALTSGINVINHKLGQKLRGYLVVMNSAAATFYDGQDTNPSPDKTLILNSSAATTVSLLVF